MKRTDSIIIRYFQLDTDDDTISPAHANTSSELSSQQSLPVGTDTYLEIDAATDPGVPKS